MDSVLLRVSHFRDTNVDSFYRSTSRLLDLAKNDDQPYYQVAALKELAFHQIIMSNYNSSILFLDMADSLVQPYEETELNIDIQTFYGLAYMGNFDYYSAIQLYKKFTSLAQRLKRPEDVLGANHMIGEIYRQCHQYEKSLEYFALSAPPASSNPAKPVERHGWWNLIIGNAYSEIKEFDKALSHYEASLAIWDKLNMIRGKGYTYNSLGKLLLESNDPECIAYFNLAIDNNALMNNYEQIIVVNVGLGNYYSTPDGPKTKVINYYNVAIQLAIEHCLEHLVLDALDFYIEHPELINYSEWNITDILKIRIRAIEFSLATSSKTDIKIIEALEKMAYSEQQEVYSKERASLLQKTIWLLSALILSIIAIIFTIYRKNRKLKDSRLQINQQYDVIKSQANILEQINDELSIKNDSLGNELELNILASNHIKSLVKSISDSNENQEIATKLRSEMKGDYWDELMFLKNFRNQHFIKSLTSQYPNLTNNEITLCCMVRMGLLSKEIAHITYRSLGSVKVARSRLRKKLELNTSINLATYLSKV